MFLPSTKEQREHLFKAARKNLSPYITHVYVPARPFRRWSGDFFEDIDDQYRLDRGNYFSVCQSNDGSDAGTLEAELNAYRNIEENFYVIFMDALIEGNAKQLNMQPSANILLLLLHPKNALERLTANAPEELHRLMTQAVDEGKPLVITLPTVITSAQIEGVVDLRQRDAQQWLFETYVNHRLIPTPANSFVDVLPELLQPNLGGATGSNSRLQVIGADLRRAGINGLIYPSARTDVGISYADDQIERFRGWNMVLYKGQTPRETSSIDFGGWETEFWGGSRSTRRLTPVAILLYGMYWG